MFKLKWIGELQEAFNKLGAFLLKDLGIRNIVYSYDSVNKINNHRFFKVTEDCQYDLHVHCTRNCFFTRESVFMDCLFDSGSLWQNHFLSIYRHLLTKTCFSVLNKFCKFHMVCTSKTPQNLMIDLCSNLKPWLIGLHFE